MSSLTARAAFCHPHATETLFSPLTQRDECVATLEEACAFRRDNPGCMIVAGGTDIGVQLNKFLRDPKVILALTGLSGMREVRLENGTIVAGAFMPADGARWVWLAGSIVLLTAGAVGYALARDVLMSPATPAEVAAN